MIYVLECIVLRHVCGACTFLTAVSPLAVCVHTRCGCYHLGITAAIVPCHEMQRLWSY